MGHEHREGWCMMATAKNVCVNCGQKLKKASADSEYTWIGQTDKSETCMAGATQIADGRMVSEQDHCSEREWGM